MSLRAALVALGVWVLGAMPVGAQGQRCELVVDSLPNSSLWQVRDPVSGTSTAWWSGGFRARCLGSDMVVTSDSAEYLGGSALLLLIGNARYREGRTSLAADVLRYYETDARLEGQGNVRMRTETGSTLSAQTLIHLRAIDGVRSSSSFVIGAPRAVLRDSASVPDSLATRIDAQRMYAVGDSLLYAGGDVIITRPDLVATGDSAEAETARERLHLLGRRPRMESRGEQAFELEARRIDVRGRARAVEQVFAQGEAEATSDSLRLASDSVLITLADGTFDRIRAWGPGRAEATTTGRDVTADSLDLRLRGQRLEELWAIGTARVETAADTAITTEDPDWIAGDTVRAQFEAGADSAQRAVLRTVEARGNARTFLQVASREPGERRPAINYVLGRRIDVLFRAGEVQDVAVSDDARGIYLEPQRGEPTAPPAGVRRPPGGTR
jgi:hypothetical protein